MIAMKLSNGEGYIVSEWILLKYKDKLLSGESIVSKSGEHLIPDRENFLKNFSLKIAYKTKTELIEWFARLEKMGLKIL